MSPRLALVAALTLLACRPRAPELAPLHVMAVAPGPAFTALTGTFWRADQVVYRDARCTAVLRSDGVDPPSRDAGRLEAWVVAGEVLGHATRRRDGSYMAAVRTVLRPGTRLAGAASGGDDVPAHRFRTPAAVPLPTRRVSPGAGFTVRRGVALPVRWEGGDASHVTLTLTLDRDFGTGAPSGPGSSPSQSPAGQVNHGLTVTCVTARGPGAFTVPPEAFARMPEGVTRAWLVVAATARVREDDWAFDVVPVGSGDDEVTGNVVP